LAVSEQAGLGLLAGDIMIKRESSAFEVGDVRRGSPLG
jgi:hypothetical protein